MAMLTIDLHLMLVDKERGFHTDGHQGEALLRELRSS